MKHDTSNLGHATPVAKVVEVTVLENLGSRSVAGDLHHVGLY